MAARAYSTLLRLLPRALVREYGGEMRRDFRQLARAGYTRASGLGVMRVVLRGTRDVLLHALVERWQAGNGNVDHGNNGRRRSPGERIMSVMTDVRVALRSLSRRPAFAVVAVLTLGLGIGANAAIFAVVNAVLIQPLPYPESERVVWFGHHAPGLDLPELNNSEATIALYERFARSFVHVASVERASRNLTGGVEPAKAAAAVVTPSVFDVLGTGPAIGRRLVAADAASGAPAVAVLTYGGWSTHFGRRPDVVGQRIDLDGVRTEVVGVMPRGFAYPNAETSLLLPRPTTTDPVFGSFGITGIARLAPGVDLEAARREVEALQPRLLEMDGELTETFFEQAGWRASVESLRDQTVGDAKTALWIVLGTVSFLLVVACASVANLFLVRAESRQREVGIRTALGAARQRIAATFLSESLLLGALGGVVGVVLAWIGVRALVAAGPPQLPRLHEVTMDGTVLLFALAVSVLSGVVFGLLPLPQQLRTPLGALLREGRGQTGSRERQRVRKTLIVAQIALSIVLLTGSGLMLRSFTRLRAVDPGIRPEGVLAVSVSAGQNADRGSAIVAYTAILDELRAMPGVRTASATNALPLAPEGLNGSSFAIESRPLPDDVLPPVVMFTAVDSDYFEVMGTPVLRGRGIERDDIDHTRPVVWVNETFERSFLDGTAVGERIRIGNDTMWLEIAGVVRDVRTFGLREDAGAFAYLPLTTTVTSANIGTVSLVVRTDGDPMALAPTVRATIRRIRPELPITTTRTMTAVLDDSLAETSFTMGILLIASVVALLLGAIGLYGVIGYVVSQRTQEIGVRIALGAMPGAVQRMVLRQGLVLAVAGVALGVLGAAALTRVLDTLLFEVSARDPLTFIAVPVVLFAVTALATYLPAARAARIDPVIAIRTE
jgi:predicted permease